MPTLMERLAKLKGVAAPANVPTPPPAPAQAPPPPGAAAPPKMAGYASAMPDVKKGLVGKVTVVEDELAVSFIAPYADEIEWDALHKKFGKEHPGWVGSTSRKVLGPGQGERVAVYMRPEAEPAPVVAAAVAPAPVIPVAAPPAGKPKTLSERLKTTAADKAAVPAAVPAPAEPKLGVIDKMKAQLSAMSFEDLKKMYEASKSMEMAPAEKMLMMQELVNRAESIVTPVEHAAPEPVKPIIEHVTPLTIEAMREEITQLPDNRFKKLLEESAKEDFSAWKRNIILAVAEERKIFREPPPSVIAVKSIDKRFLTDEKPDKEKFKHFLLSRGFNIADEPPKDEDILKELKIDFELKPEWTQAEKNALFEKRKGELVHKWETRRPEHTAVAQRLWEAYIKDKVYALPWEELSTEDKRMISSNYMGRIKTLGYPLEEERLRRGFKSVDDLVGSLWERYGRHWEMPPLPEVGLGTYPGGVPAGEWHDKFMSYVMRKPYSARVQRAQELYNQYGIFGKMPPLSEFVFPADITKFVAEGAEASDVHAVRGFFKEAGRPLDRRDFEVIFEGDAKRVDLAMKQMYDYTEDRFHGDVYSMLDEMVKTPEGKEKLKFIALTYNSRILGNLVHDRNPMFDSTEEGFINLAYEKLLEYLPKILPVEERDEIVDVIQGNKYNEKRVSIDADMERILPSWDNIQVMNNQKDLIKKWDDLVLALGRPASAADFYMRYPGMSKETARTIEENRKFDDIKKLWEGNLPSKEQIEKMVPTLTKQISEYKVPKELLSDVKKHKDEIEKDVSKSKDKLEKDLLMLDRLNDIYMYQTGKRIVEKVNIGNFLMGASIADAKEFARKIYRPEWLAEGDFVRIAAVIKERKRIPNYDDLVAEFGDPAMARVVMALFSAGEEGYVIPSNIKLSEDTIREVAANKGIVGTEAVEKAINEFRELGLFPMAKDERERFKGLKEHALKLRRFMRVVGRAVPREFTGRLEEIRALKGSLAIQLQKYGVLIEDLENKVAAKNIELAELVKKKSLIIAKKTHTKQQVEAAEAELMVADDELTTLYTELSTTRHDRLALVKTLPKVDYTRGQARIDHDDYVQRKVTVKGNAVEVTLEDVYKYWVAPVEAERKALTAKKPEGPADYELMEIEPSIDKILAEEKAGKAVPDKEKKIAVIVLMNYAREQGAYNFEYEMAQIAKDLGIKNMPLFALPATTDEQRSVQFIEWLKFGLTRQEIEKWQPHVQLAYIGEDWTECSWDGEPKKLEDVAGQKVHLQECAIHKAKAAQSAAIQLLTPTVLQPIIVAAGEGAPPTPELAKLQEEIEKLKAALADKTAKLAESQQIGKEILKKMTNVSDLEAKISGLEEQGKSAPTIVASTTPGGKRSLYVRRKATPQEIEGLKAQKVAVQKEIEAAVGKEKAEQMTKGTAAQVEELKELSKKIERERSKSRDVCFFREEWSTIKAAIGEHMASNTAQLTDIQGKLTAARASGLSGASVYESAFQNLKEERQVLDELVEYIKGAEKGAPDKFLCTDAETKTLRG